MVEEEGKKAGGRASSRSAAVEEKPPTIGKEDAEPKACEAARPEEKENVCVSSSENVQEVGGSASGLEEGGTTSGLPLPPPRKKRGPSKEPKEQCPVCLRYYSLKRVVPGGHANCVPPVAKEKTIKEERAPPPSPPEDDRNLSVASMSCSFTDFSFPKEFFLALPGTPVFRAYCTSRLQTFVYRAPI